MSEEEIIKMLKDRLSIEVTTTSEYNGAADGPLYKDVSTVKLILDGCVISEASL